jgi:hypothetical protein
VYAEKARLAAESAVSELRSSELAAQSWVDGDLFQPYVETVVVDSETALDSIASTFTSIQPPAGAATDQLRHEVSDAPSSASDSLVELRIASWFFRWIHRDTQLIDWEDIVDRTTDTITVRTASASRRTS